MSYKPENSSRSEESTEVPGGGVDARLIARLVFALAVVVLAVIFIAQNSERVELRFVFFDVTTRVWVGLVVALVLGALLGQGIEAVVRRRRRRAARG
ncbi:MAG TPA: hypothetical protein VFZ68_08105 [Acidimicrobiales bacterium]